MSHKSKTRCDHKGCIIPGLRKVYANDPHNDLGKVHMCCRRHHCTRGEKGGK
jgi:hypothetical protein